MNEEYEAHRKAILEKFAEPIPVLDHGYVQLVDIMGSDSAIAAAARISYAGEKTQKSSSDAQLVRYLVRHFHTSPLETACAIKLQVKLPIFVERQWVRHRTSSLNEMSARYSVLPQEFYYPTEDSVRAQSKTNKQGREEELDPTVVHSYLAEMQRVCQDAYTTYESFTEQDIARELARCALPVNIYTKKVWRQDLHNLFHFLRLRMDSHAQWEIQQYAKAISTIVKEWVPVAYKAFEDYRLNAVSFSAQEITAIRDLLDLHAIEPSSVLECLHMDTPTLSKREEQEFLDKLYPS